MLPAGSPLDRSARRIGRGISAARAWRPRARLAAATAFVAVAAITGSALAAQHLDHYAARADTGGRGVLAEMWAQPICDGSLSGSGEAQVAQLK